MDTTTIEWVSSGSRWLTAGGMLLAYAGLCTLVRRGWQERQAAGAAGTARAASLTETTSSADDAPWLVYASQSGQAEAWAQHSLLALHTAHPSARMLPLDALTAADLHVPRTLLFIVSTTGEGDAPDNALDFERRVMSAAGAVASLRQVRYGLMALGDRDYSAYCGFGRRLDAWLRQHGAQALFERIEVNQADPAGLAAWRRELDRWAGPADGAGPADSADAPFLPWRVRSVECLNPGSAGQPLVQLRLQPASGEMPSWHAGDVAQVLPRQAEPVRSTPRDYSVANLPQDGELRLLVRRQVDASGRLGTVSGWLTGGDIEHPLRVGETVALRLRSHRGFQLDVGEQTPLILIGNGSGLAGLRAHLQQRAQAVAASGQPAPAHCTWLLFGERSRVHDTLLADELSVWQSTGVLSRLDRVYSRDCPAAPYVQHRLRSEAARLREWVAAGACILVCGSLAGMGQGVNAALREILGEDAVNALTRSGRIRRDLY